MQIAPGTPEAICLLRVRELGQLKVASARTRMVVELHHLVLQTLHRHVSVDDEAMAAAILVHETDDSRRELAATAVLADISGLTHLKCGEDDLKLALLVARILECVEELLAARASFDGEILLGGGHADHSFQ